MIRVERDRMWMKLATTFGGLRVAKKMYLIVT